MRDGLDRDDIYIMVEDEFHAVAKQFTQHLHHAEYVRLKNLSKARNASTISTISRPTDSITAMRVETKKKKENEAKAARQKAALEQIKGRAMQKRSSESEDELDMQVKEDDPWAGTTLQGLMTSPSRNNTSLTGLQGVLSSTRAAAGFSKPRASVTPRKDYELDPQAVSKTSSTRTANSTAAPRSEALGADDDDETVSDDDDLDAPVTRARPTQNYNTSTAAAAQRESATKNRTSKHHVLPTSKEPSPTPPLSKVIQPGQSLYNSKSNLKRTNPLSLPSVPNEILKPLPIPQSEAVKRIMKRRADLNARKDRELAESKDKAGSVNEIPIFLV